MQQWAERKRARADSPRSLPADAPMAEAVRSVQAAVEREYTSPIDLDNAMRERMESHFGPGFSRVRLVQSDLPGQLGARAIAQGDLIRFAPGAFQPGTEAGERLLSHELGHVVQQGRGGAMGGAAGLPLYDSGAEAGADAIASQTMDGGLSGGLGSFSPAPAAQAPMQGDGFFASIKKWFADWRAKKEENEARKNATLERMYESRAWKIDPAALAQNAENPTGNARLQAWLNTLGPQDGQQATLPGLFNAFKRMMVSRKLSGELPAGSDVKGVRERMGVMFRTMLDFPILRAVIGGFGSMNERGAVMAAGLSPTGFGQNTIIWNPAHTSNDAPTDPQKAGFERLYERLRFNATNMRFAGAHELGHVLNTLLIEKRRLLWARNKDNENGETASHIINKAIRQLAAKETRKKQTDPNAKQTFNDFLERQRQNGNYNYKTKTVDFGGNQENQENQFDDVNNIEDRAIMERAIAEERAAGNDVNVNPYEKAATRQMNKADAAKMDLYHMGQVSRYGAVNPGETFAELIADVYANGKGASDLARRVYKLTWRKLNPEAAALEKKKKLERRAGAQAAPPGQAGQP